MRLFHAVRFLTQRDAAYEGASLSPVQGPGARILDAFQRTPILRAADVPHLLGLAPEDTLPMVQDLIRQGQVEARARTDRADDIFLYIL